MTIFLFHCVSILILTNGIFSIQVQTVSVKIMKYQVYVSGSLYKIYRKVVVYQNISMPRGLMVILLFPQYENEENSIFSFLSRFQSRLRQRCAFMIYLNAICQHIMSKNSVSLLRGCEVMVSTSLTHSQQDHAKEFYGIYVAMNEMKHTFTKQA